MTSRAEREMQAEMREHIARSIALHMARGMAEADATAAAHRAFGNLPAIQEEARDARGRRLWHDLVSDVRYGVRALARAPGFTAIIAVTLALGIGPTTAIFSVVRGVLLRPLPFYDPSRLVVVRSTYHGTASTSSAANVADFRQRSTSFLSIAATADGSTVLTGAGDPVTLNEESVSADFFSTLGVNAIAGRATFTPSEAAWAGENAVIISEALWRSRFGADSGCVRSMITLDGERYRVVGIVGRAGVWPPGAQVWTPLRLDPAYVPKSRGAQYLSMIARLKPGVSVTTATADVRAIAAQLANDYPRNNTGLSAVVIGLHESVAGDLRRPLWLLLGGVVFVLIIACANVANLQLARGILREREMALRAALGAGRGRLLRQLLTETAILVATGAVLGVVLARVGVHFLLVVAPPGLPQLDAVRLDGIVVAFAVGIAVVSGFAFGLFPARHLLRRNLSATLRDSGRSATHRAATNRVRRGLVVAEVALSVTLLAGAGLLVRSFQRLTSVDPGFRTERAMSFELGLPDAAYRTPESRVQFVNEFAARTRAVPGVVNVGAAFGLPLTDFSFSLTTTVEGRPHVDPAQEVSAQVRVATTDYLATMGIPVIRGRGFTDEDRSGAAHVLVISQTAASRLFPNEDPLGKHLSFPWYRGQQQFGGEIVGVVADVKQQSLAAAARPQVWAPFAQWPTASITVIMRTQGEPLSAMAAARAIVRNLNPSLAITHERTLDDVVAASVAQPRFYMLLLTAFSTVALLLTAVGIYGVIAYLAGQREREIGIRVALGASHANVAGMILREGIATVAVGVAAGLVGALGVTQLMRGLLFEITPGDFPTYVAVSALLAAVAIVASLVPALRAIRVDPALAMRAD